MSLNFKSDHNKFKKGLYLISTPIGNLEDITFRAIEILKNSDHILCEDTRVSKNLLKKHNINSNLISYHKFNEAKSLDKVVKLLQSGSLISLISDAGTPLISDPGKLILIECIKNNITIIPIPGPSAVTSAVSMSGFSEKFYFYGFLPEKKKILNDDLLMLSSLNCSIVFFVSAKKLERAITEFKKYFLERNVLICREMTKIYEEFFRSSVREIDISKLTLKGEVTVVISEKINEKKSSQTLSESDKNKIKKMIKKFSIKEITALICFDKKISKKDVYNYYLKIKNEN
tara:strand:+ start:951 stop:1814 length:864 start_codon:yes stop_codon:yes gene_type:complete